MIDQQWAEYARASREALSRLGYDVKRCLPDEPGACGGGWAEHVAGYLAGIKAVVDHQLDHLGAPVTMIEDIYQHISAELHEQCGDHG
ncbi:MAG TPA: hypothetical protein VFB06_34510 [Streptosporangiaceae bacterium]|nr:hypothetical protein [Streptosporangiaceae bacterium]